MELITSWERKGRAEGLREGRAEGLREGLREGQRLVVERILTRRFGALLPLTGVGFWGSPFAPSLVLGFRMPNSPFQPLVGEGGREEEGQTRTGMQTLPPPRPRRLYGRSDAAPLRRPSASPLIPSRLAPLASRPIPSRLIPSRLAPLASRLAPLASRLMQRTNLLRPTPIMPQCNRHPFIDCSFNRATMPPHIRHGHRETLRNRAYSI